MNIFLGTDICEIERIEKIYQKYGEKFLKRTYTSLEASYCIAKPLKTNERLAVRFAVKEAVSKALGVGLNKLGWAYGIDFRDVELMREANGAVSLKLTGIAKKLADEKGIKNWTVSVAHSKTDAVATVVGW